MFREWGFLLGEIWVLLALAALIGLLAGWIIWGRRTASTGGDATLETDRLRGALADCEGRTKAQAARLAALERELNDVAARAPAPVVAAPVVAVAPVAAPMAALAAVPETGAALRPARMEAARNGAPDDLKLIKGIGPKLEVLCHSLGFFHFDQIAAWTAAEVAWVDDNLEGFKGRVTRDEWVAQAKVLAAGGTTEFARRVEDGGVY